VRKRPTPRLLIAVAAAICLATLDPGPLRGQGPGAFVEPALDTALRLGSPDETHAVWVYFRDKGAGPVTRPAPLSARALGRRARRAPAARRTAYEDRALAVEYVERVAARVTRVRHALRWFNAISVEATAGQVQALTALPFVERLDLVRREPRVDEPVAAIDSRRERAVRPRAAALDYGSGFDQVAQLKVPELHERGLTGEGVVVALFDSGFPNLDHEALAAMNVVAQRDFVRQVDTVRSSTHMHGLATLSVIGGFRPGELIGPAFGASYILAVTEDDRSERPIEEDNWAAAAEWAEAMGVDIISSSLGYSVFDRPFPSYSDRDMDGATAVTTRAAFMAAARGVVVVNSAGNGGLHPTRNTLVAPADGLYVLAAGGVDRAGIRSTFSSVGPTADGRIKPDVAALGTAVKIATTATTASYGFASGTSFSCPLIAGVAALVLQANPTFIIDDVLLALRATASQRAAPDNLLGWGIVDASAAVAFQPPPAPSGGFNVRYELSRP
jgi:subtilisin family serine protease